MGQIKKGEVRNPYGRKGKPREDGWQNLLSGAGTARAIARRRF